MARDDTTLEVPAHDNRVGTKHEPRCFSLVVAWYADVGRVGERVIIGEVPVTLGRDSGPGEFPCGPFLSGLISRQHARVRRHAGGVVVEDLGSRNGTWVDGVRIASPVTIGPNSVIRVGDLLLVVECEPAIPAGSRSISWVGVSSQALVIGHRLHQYASNDLPVLLLGETGTGKEVAASSLHFEGKRQSRPWVAIDCPNIPTNLWESELFGYRKGAFSGASSDQPGRIISADSGTLFLDEVGELPFEVQSRLLRVLETRAVVPLGSSKPVDVDIRVVAATNRDLFADARSGRFRTDLLTRISGMTITLPPLRERRADVPILAHTMLQRCGCSSLFSAADMETLCLQPWPGNVRSLRSVVSVASTEGSPVYLGPESRQQLSLLLGLVQTDSRVQHPAFSEEVNLSPTAELLCETLRRCKGNVSDAARELGTHRFQLYRWLKRAGVDPGEFRTS